MGLTKGWLSSRKLNSCLEILPVLKYLAFPQTLSLFSPSCTLDYLTRERKKAIWGKQSSGISTCCTKSVS